MDGTLTVPHELRILVVAPEQQVIYVPPEWRAIRVMETMLIASKRHTEGDTMQWTIQYGRWLANGATITAIDVTSDSDTCTVGTPTILGEDVVFSLIGGVLNERLAVKLAMTDSIGNIKHDTVKFTVVAP